MRTPDTIFEQYIGNGQMGIDYEKKHIIEAISEAQKEAFNEGIYYFAGKIEGSCGMTLTKEIIRDAYNKLKKP